LGYAYIITQKQIIKMIGSGKATALVLTLALIASFSAVALSVSAQGIGDIMPCADGDKKPCGSNVGECTAGERTCMGGQWGPCIGGTLPVNEICDNGKDDDCDGIADECVEFVGSFGIILISGGVMLLILAAVLSRVFK
jgi:hypothetical protein